MLMAKCLAVSLPGLRRFATSQELSTVTMALAAKQSAPFVAGALASVSVCTRTRRLWQYCSRDIRTSYNTEDMKMY